MQHVRLGMDSNTLNDRYQLEANKTTENVTSIESVSNRIIFILKLLFETIAV